MGEKMEIRRWNITWFRWHAIWLLFWWTKT